MKLEIVLIGFVLFFLVTALALKSWERHERKQYDTKLNVSKRRIFRSRTR